MQTLVSKALKGAVIGAGVGGALGAVLAWYKSTAGGGGSGGLRGSDLQELMPAIDVSNLKAHQHLYDALTDLRPLSVSSSDADGTFQSLVQYCNKLAGLSVDIGEAARDPNIEQRATRLGALPVRAARYLTVVRQKRMELERLLRPAHLKLAQDYLGVVLQGAEDLSSNISLEVSHKLKA